MYQLSLTNVNVWNLRNIGDNSDEMIGGLKSIDASDSIRFIYKQLHKYDSKTHKECAQYSPECLV